MDTNIQEHLIPHLEIPILQSQTQPQSQAQSQNYHSHTNSHTTYSGLSDTPKETKIQGGIKIGCGIIENLQKIYIGNWSLELDQTGDLCIKNDDSLKAKISSEISFIENVRCERVFMIQPVNIQECIGMFVSYTGSFYNFDMSQTPNDTQAICTVKLSNQANDPCILGAIIGCENYTRNYQIGVFNSVHLQEDNINRVMISNHGMQSVWVCDINGNLHKGDYITTSDIPGYGMKQDDTIRHNYTGPKIMHNCTFHPNVIVLQQPVDFDNEGPIFEPITNIDGEQIIDTEYKIKYIRKDGSIATKSDFINEITALTKLNKKNVLKNTKRTIFRACLVGACYL